MKESKIFIIGENRATYKPTDEWVPELLAAIVRQAIEDYRTSGKWILKTGAEYETLCSQAKKRFEFHAKVKLYREAKTWIKKGCGGFYQLSGQQILTIINNRFNIDDTEVERVIKKCLKMELRHL